MWVLEPMQKVLLIAVSSAVLGAGAIILIILAISYRYRGSKGIYITDTRGEKKYITDARGAKIYGIDKIGSKGLDMRDARGARVNILDTREAKV